MISYFDKKNTHQKLQKKDKELSFELTNLDHKILLINKNDPEYLDMLYRQKFNYVTEDEIISFAKQYDPQWFHTDKDEAKNSNFKGIIASGIHVAALWRLLDHEINGNINFVCGIGWDNVRWKNPLRPNNKIYVTSECISKSQTSSKDRGVAVFDHSVKYEDTTDILVFKGTCLIHKKQ